MDSEADRKAVEPRDVALAKALQARYQREIQIDNGAAIPPNLIAIPNTESNSFYLRYCEENGFKPHPARYPAELPEYFIRMLTDPGDFVVDPFAGSCVTGEVCERLKRRWTCIEMTEEYCQAAIGRFVRSAPETAKCQADPDDPANYYRVPRPGILWDCETGEPLSGDGGKRRRLQRTKRALETSIATNNRRPQQSVLPLAAQADNS